MTVLIGLGVVLYWRPAAAGWLDPRWWHWVTLGFLFFGLAGVATFRRRQQGNRALHEEIREAARREADR